MTIRAIYENGVFRPVEPVHLPEHSEVQIQVPAVRSVTTNTSHEADGQPHA